MMRVAVFAIAILISSVAMAEERLTCQLFGDDYPLDKYPDGATKTWWIDGDKLNQGSKGSRLMAVPGLAWMKILNRTDDVLVAEWPTLVKGASHRFVVDLNTGATEETSYFKYKSTDNTGICRLEVEGEA